MSAKITPVSKVMAALNPLVMLVSINIKKTGPIMKLRKKPSNIPVKNKSICKKMPILHWHLVGVFTNLQINYLTYSILPPIVTFSLTSFGVP